MKSVYLFFMLFLVYFSTWGQSQDFLLLKRGTNTKSQIRYYVGEQITYKSTKIGYFVSDIIKEFKGDYIYMSENIISLQDIEEIDIRSKDRRNGRLRAFNGVILGAGIVLLGVESINSVYQNGELSVDKGVGVISGILIGTGIAMLPLRYKTFKHEGRNRLQIIQMRITD